MTDEHGTRMRRKETKTGADRERALLAAQAVATATGTPASVLVSRRRLPHDGQRARCMAIYLAHTEYGWALRRVGAAFDRDRTTVSAACRWIEDLRDDPVVDRLLDRLARGLNEILDLGAPA